MLKTFITFYCFLLRYKWQSALFVIVLVVLSIAESIQPYFYKLFVDQLTSTENLADNKYQQLFYTLIIFMGVRITKEITDILTYFTGDRILFKSARDARLAVFKKIQDLDFAYHLSKSTGSLISIIKRGDSAFFNMFHSININLTRILINFIIILFFFAQMRWEITAIISITFIISLIFTHWLISYNMITRKKFNQAEDDLSGIIVDNLINYETVKLFAKESWEYRRLQTEFKPWMTTFWKFANSFRAIDISIGTIANLGLFLILLFSLNQTSYLRMTTGEFVLILGLVSSFYPRLFELVFRFRDIAKNYTDLQKYFEILDQTTLIKDPDKPVEMKSVKGEIEFKNVTFTYPEAKIPALKNFSLKIRQGQSIAFVGTSGVGKTTIVKLLMRFYDVDQGEILIDNINIKNFTKTQLRSYMGVVPQEPILFNNTINFNIGYGKENSCSKEIKAAASVANLEDLINSLPNKYETKVGERGIKLSGGQKQRLAIARMILANPDIIIFDEATSQLDSQSEQKIQEAFWKAAKNKTTLIIAHRLSTITKVDQIVVMHRGRVKEKGSHQDLINRPASLYQKFWELQTRKYQS